MKVPVIHLTEEPGSPDEQSTTWSIDRRVFLSVGITPADRYAWAVWLPERGDKASTLLQNGEEKSMSGSLAKGQKAATDAYSDLLRAEVRK